MKVENGPILQKPWQGAAPHRHGGAAEPGDGQDDRECGKVNVVNNSAILAGGKAQYLLSQVVKVNIGNEDHGEVDVTMDNENANMVNVDSVSEGNPEQVLTGQVVGMVSVSEV